MVIITGLVILVAAVVADVAGVLSNSGGGHALTRPFAVFGYHVTGSAGTLFLIGQRDAARAYTAGRVANGDRPAGDIPATTSSPAE